MHLLAVVLGGITPLDPERGLVPLRILLALARFALRRSVQCAYPEHDHEHYGRTSVWPARIAPPERPFRRSIFQTPPRGSPP